MFIDKNNLRIPLIRQCNLIDLSRSTCYYKPCRNDSYNELLMRLIDAEYTRHPFYEREQLTNWLGSMGHHVNSKRVRRLMRLIRFHSSLSKKTPAAVYYGGKI